MAEEGSRELKVENKGDSSNNTARLNSEPQGTGEDSSSHTVVDSSNVHGSLEINESDERKSKRMKTDDYSNAFSRKDNSYTASAGGTPSVYSEEMKKLPAWLKSGPDDKYDRYGIRTLSRNSPAGAESVGKDERYSKYGAVSSNDGVERIKRSRDELESYGYDRGNYRNEDKYKDEGEAAPYSNLEVTNPASKYYQTFSSNIGDKDNRDINSIVRSHYNQRTYQSKHQGSRTQSPIYKLRNFNNAIKYMLLGNFVNRQSDGRLSVLDLCCGKGGDLNKYEFVSIDQYIGIDISDASIKEAFSRYSKNKARFVRSNQTKKDSRKYNFEACFATGDCFQQSVPEILEPNFPGIINALFPVDTVSVQFSLHYSFESEDKVRTLLNNVSKSLRKGGTFIGTIPSSDFIRDKIIRKSLDSGHMFGNDLYAVTFDKSPPDDGAFRPPFGHRYTYFLKDAVDNVPEYVVPFQAFRAMCEDYGLVLRYKKGFVDIFNEEIPKYFSKLNKNLIQSMKRSDGKYGAEGSEKEAIAFYLGFVFEKLS